MTKQSTKNLKKLIIVESPAKGKTIQKYLGDDYIVMASFGHIADLASGGKNGLGVDIQNNFKPKYVLLQDKIQTVDNLISAAEKCNEILLWVDKDREGEAISWHLKQRLESTGLPIKRGTFGEITKPALLAAIKSPRDVDLNLFKAQESRRILDRLVGYMVSPFVINNFGENNSAGRVQSVSAKIITDREREIENFQPEEYWNIFANLTNDSKTHFQVKYDNRISNKKDAEQVKLDCLGGQFIVEKVLSKEKKENPQPPLVTAKLQQIMARKYNFSSEKTMKLAQTLYEQGYVTYIRTDSTRISDDALKSVRKWLSENDFEVPKAAKQYKAKEAAQDAHECIRPTNLNNKPDEISLGEDEASLYKVIWQYFVASQMMPAVFDTLEIKVKSIKNPKHIFKAGGKALKSKGYLDMMTDQASDQKIDLPNLKEKDLLDLFGKNPILCEQKFTQPPPRFTEETLIKYLEDNQIGRPATYAQITKTITNRNYVEKKGKSYYATDLGKKITDVLSKFFPFMQYQYTANLEKQLDDIAEGKLDSQKMLKDFFDPFKKQLAQAYADYGAETCERCGNVLSKRKNKKDGSEFLGCASYPKCTFTKSLKGQEK